MKIESLRDVVIEELQDLYDAEQQIVEALPKMAEAASEAKLRKAFESHLKQTEGQVKRLEQVFETLGESPKKKTCKGMQGLIKEGEEIIKMEGDPASLDAAIIAAAQKVEHYEIAAYGSARTHAEQLGESEVAELLQQTLDEESETDEKLTQIAESAANVKAASRA